MDYERKIALVPLWMKTTLTLEEANAYSGISVNKLIDLSNDPDCDFIMWVGRKRLFKRKRLEEFIERSYSI